MNEVIFKKNQVIFKEGDTPDYIYIIKKGRVKIYRTIRDLEKVYAILGPGEIFGEMGVLSKTPRSASAMAVEDSVLSKVNEKEIIEILKDNPVLNLILQSLIERIKHLNEKINFVSLCHEEFRLCYYIGLKYMEEGKLTSDLEEIKYFTDIPEDRLSSFLRDLKLRNIIDISGGKTVILKDPKKIIEHSKYLFLRGKYAKKEKIKNKKFHTLI